jgi:prepilin-type processing-associated H-X9-DG protein/prepilin-type N-terminal cleavage/methylation domain-containing protein
MPRATHRRTAFTLVELLVVISIIGMLMALLLPAVQSARETGRANTCRNNVKNLALAVLAHESARREFPGYVTLINSNPRSWSFVLLPRLERQDLYDAYSPQFTADGVTPMPQPTEELEIMQCPSDPPEGTVNAPPSSYVVNAGCPDALASACVAGSFVDWPGNGVFHDLRTWNYSGGDPIPLVGMRSAYISAGDGMQNTIMLSENVDALSWSLYGDGNIPSYWERQMAFVWWDALGGDPPVPAPNPEARINGYVWGDPQLTAMTYARPGAYHPGGVNMAFCDGHVRFISQDIDYLIYALMMTTRGREVRTPGTLDAVNEIFRQPLDEARIP